MAASGLVANRGVLRLNLSRNLIADAGARAIARLLHPTSVLAHVDLTDNKIGEDGARAVAAALTTNASCAFFSLRLNHSVGDAGGAAVFRALMKNTTTQQINLAACSLASESAAALAELIARPRGTLISIDVGANDFSEADGKKLEAAVKARPISHWSPYDRVGVVNADP